MIGVSIDLCICILSFWCASAGSQSITIAETFSLSLALDLALINSNHFVYGCDMVDVDGSGMAIAFQTFNIQTNAIRHFEL